jgi:diguanylate cyclase (GGDEF)-like protein
LIEITRLLQSNLRNTDYFGRWGGEEFMIICPHTTESDAFKVAEKLRQLLATRYIAPVGYKTASFGVIACAPTHQSPQDILHYADEALYRAKRRGRNCTVCY